MAEADLIIEPRKGRKEKSLPPRVLLVVNPADAELAFEVFKPFAGLPRRFYHARIAVAKNRHLCVAGPALGAPSAALLLEKLVVLGGAEIWLVSCCGSLDPAHDVGDVLIGTAAVSGEGVSRYYSSAAALRPDGRATADLADFVQARSIGAEYATIWSTDAPYRERRSELLRLRERYGVTGVDMEYSALCSVAAFRTVSLGALFVVSDLLWTRTWRPGFGAVEFKGANRDLVEALIQYGVQREMRT